MAASTSILPEKLHEYPQQDVIDGSVGESASILDDCINQNDGVLQLLHRYAGRTFCSPGKRLRLDEGSYHPITWAVPGWMKFGWVVPYPLLPELLTLVPARHLTERGSPMFLHLTGRSFRCRI